MTNRLDNKVKYYITNSFINMLSQKTFDFQNWDSINIFQTAIYYFQFLAFLFIKVYKKNLFSINSFAIDLCFTMQYLY